MSRNNKKDKSNGFFYVVKTFFCDERTKFALGIILLIFVLTCFWHVSFFFTGEAVKVVNGSWAKLERLKELPIGRVSWSLLGRGYD